MRIIVIASALANERQTGTKGIALAAARRVPGAGANSGRTVMQKTTGGDGPAYTAAHSVDEVDECADFEAELVEFDGEHDHVHLLVNYPPEDGLLLREIISHATLDDVRTMTAAPFRLSPAWRAPTV